MVGQIILNSESVGMFPTLDPFERAKVFLSN
jgi:hypothetical protein